MERDKLHDNHVMPMKQQQYINHSGIVRTYAVELVSADLRADSRSMTPLFGLLRPHSNWVMVLSGSQKFRTALFNCVTPNCITKITHCCRLTSLCSRHRWRGRNLGAILAANCARLFSCSRSFHNPLGGASQFALLIASRR